jgi:acyl carrier protein
MMKWMSTFERSKDPSAAVAPETHAAGIETTIRVIWSAILKREAIGRHDNFFELGGDSLAATRVVTRLSRAVGVLLRVPDIFEAPTIASLSRLVVDRATGPR